MPDHSDAQVSSRNKDVSWYSSDIGELSPATKELLHSYSGIPEDQIIPHILKVVRAQDPKPPSLVAPTAATR